MLASWRDGLLHTSTAAPGTASSPRPPTCSAPAGVDAVSLDDIAAEVGVAKQTFLYWFPSKDELVEAVLEARAAELAVVIDAAVRAAPDEPLDRDRGRGRAVFRPAVRRPALLGLVREVSRLPAGQADRLRPHVDPLVDRAVAFLGAEMDAGRLRRADPAPRRRARLRHGHRHRHRARGAARRRLGPATAGLRHLRTELRAFLRRRACVARRPRSAGLVLRRRRAWRSSARPTSSSISSGYVSPSPATAWGTSRSA